MVPTITTLLKLAAAVGLPIGHFVEDGGRAEPWAPIATFVPAGAARPPPPRTGPPRPGACPAHAVAGPTARLRASAVRQRTSRRAAAAARAPPPRAGEELVLVLDGVLALEVAGERYRLDAGDALHYPTDRPTSGTTPARPRAGRLVHGSG